jgi:hypothetical protein
VVVALVILLPIFKNQAGQESVRSRRHWQQSHNFFTMLTDFKQDKTFDIPSQETKDLNLFCLLEDQYIVRTIQGYCLNEVQMTKGHLGTTLALRY